MAKVNKMWDVSNEAFTWFGNKFNLFDFELIKDRNKMRLSLGLNGVIFRKKIAHGNRN
jgi:hypothetical protein